MLKIKNVLIDLQLEGNGIVNYDSNDQKYVLGNTHLRNTKGLENVSYGKKVFSTKEDGNTDFKLKISRDCIIHSMYEKDMISRNPNIVHHDYLLYTYMASPLALLTGYLFPLSKETFKRKSALTLCDAIQTCNAKSVIETFSRSGEKNDKVKDNFDSKDTSFYSKETIGDIKYSAIGDIDLMQLQFVSCDSVFDRYAFNPDMYSLYKELMSKKFPAFNAELGYYQLKNSVIEIPEYGYLLSNENVNYLTKELLKRLLVTTIRRKGAFAKVSTLKIKLVENPVINTFKDNNNWITLKSFDDINNLNFDVEFFYEQIDGKKAKELRVNFENKIKNEEERRKTEKVQKSVETKAKKAEAKQSKKAKDE